VTTSRMNCSNKGKALLNSRNFHFLS
jgi:hypothetical protein